MKKRWEEKHIDFIKKTAGLLTGEAYRQFRAAFPDFPTTYKAFAKKKSGCDSCKAESKKTKWTAEMLEAVKQARGQNREMAYKAFCKRFAGITEVAFYHKVSHKVERQRPHGSNKRAKLYEERVKSGYVQIKIAEPCTWISKARWVWEETHPAELTAKTDRFVFLNGNIRDFRPENVERIEAKYRTLFIKYGGVDSDPEITRIRILLARIRAAQLDLGEKVGIVRTNGSGRVEIKNLRKRRRTR